MKLKVVRQLRGFNICSDQVPALIDELPLLSVIAAAAEGVSEFQGLAELRHKESNRFQKIVELLKAIGASYEVAEDGLRIFGGSEKFESFQYDAQGDHRMAMTAGVAALHARKSSVIVGAQCVEISFPGFFDVLKSMG